MNSMNDSSCFHQTQTTPLKRQCFGGGGNCGCHDDEHENDSIMYYSTYSANRSGPKSSPSSPATPKSFRSRRLLGRSSLSKLVLENDDNDAATPANHDDFDFTHNNDNLNASHYVIVTSSPVVLTANRNTNPIRVRGGESLSTSPINRYNLDSPNSKSKRRSATRTPETSAVVTSPFCIKNRNSPSGITTEHGWDCCRSCTGVKKRHTNIDGIMVDTISSSSNGIRDGGHSGMICNEQSIQNNTTTRQHEYQYRPQKRDSHHSHSVPITPLETDYQLEVAGNQNMGCDCDISSRSPAWRNESSINMENDILCDNGCDDDDDVFDGTDHTQTNRTLRTTCSTTNTTTSTTTTTAGIDIISSAEASSLKRLEDVILRVEDLKSSQPFLSLLKNHRREQAAAGYGRRDRSDWRSRRDAGVGLGTSLLLDRTLTPPDGDDDDDDDDDDDVLCAERVSQMTKTYNDIEAVSRLLEEKERDLELAARIGQTLLSKNKELSVKNECLDEQLSLANDRVHQLRHDLSLKEELLRFFNEDLEDENKEDTSPAEPSDECHVNMDFLQKKVDTLENENVTLRLESANLKSTTASYEDKEKKLVEDCIKQLAEVNCQVETFADELQHKSLENETQRDQITKFLTQTADLQVKIRKLTVDNMDLHDKLTTSSDSQRKLTKELGRMQDKYDELYEMLEEAQVELQVMSKNKVRGTDRHHQNANNNVPTDSLASELEMSLQQELEESSRRAQSWKIFETARAAKRAVAKVGHSPHHSHSHQHQHHHHHHRSLGSPSMASSSVRSLPLNTSAPALALRSRHDSDAVSYGYSAYTSDGESMNSDGYTADMDSLYGSNQELGRPGIPGSNDLESALRRLALRRENSERGEMEAEDAMRRMGRGRSETSLSTAPLTPRVHSPGGMSTPSSCLSIPGSGCSPAHSAVAALLKSSDKLKIMKPLEGSVTLRHWQHLATPNLSGIFESREGVQLKGERRLDMDEEEIYCLSDYEEDVMEGRRKAGTPSTLVHSLTDAAVRSPGMSRDWPGLQDPRTPSPGLSYYSHMPSSSTTTLTPSGFHNNKPIQSSTPVLHSAYSTSNLTTTVNANHNHHHHNNQNNNAHDNSNGSGMSLGLAALLDSGSGIGGGGSGDSNRNSPILRGSVMRAALPLSSTKKGASSASSTTSSSSSSSLRKKQNDFNNILSSLSTAAFTSTLSSSNLSSLNSSGGATMTRNNKSFPGSGGRLSISASDIASTSTPRANFKSGSSSILMTTQNLLQRYHAVPGSGSSEESPRNTNVKATTVAGALSSSSSSVVSTSSLSLPITSISASLLSSSSSSSSAATGSTSTTTAASEDKNSWVFSPGMTGQGFLQQLKNRGFSLYGLWANATAAASGKMPGAEEASSSSSSSSSLPASSASNNNSYLSSTVDGNNLANNNSNSNTNNDNSRSSSSNSSMLGLNFMSSGTGKSSPIDLEAEELLNSPTATTTTVSTMPRGGGGVFGTYAGFRRGKML